MPRGAGKYGRMYVGFEDLSSQGGVNEKGLWLDAFGLPTKPVSTAQGEIHPGDLQDKLMADCGTGAEVLEMLKRYSRAPTVYSYIADLVRGVVYLYHFHNFENVVVLDVAKELDKGAHVYDLPEMFPKTVAAMTFDYLARKELADK